MNNVKTLDNLVSELLQLPKIILKHIHTTNLTELLLGHLASKECFNLKKATYLLNNPDFNCMKGLVGIDSCDIDSWKNTWDNPLENIKLLENSSFNKKIKSFTDQSLFKNLSEKNMPKILEYAKDNFEFTKPAFIGWNGKHGNHGLFFCEAQNPETFAERLHLLEHASPLLGITHS